MLVFCFEQLMYTTLNLCDDLVLNGPRVAYSAQTKYTSLTNIPIATCESKGQP